MPAIDKPEDLLRELANAKNYPDSGQFIGTILFDRLMENTLDSINLLKRVIEAVFLLKKEDAVSHDADNAKQVETTLTRLAKEQEIIRINLQSIIDSAKNPAYPARITNTNSSNDYLIAALANKILETANGQAAHNYYPKP
jgi:hypothetical protein